MATLPSSWALASEAQPPRYLSVSTADRLAVVGATVRARAKAGVVGDDVEDEGCREGLDGCGAIREAEVERAVGKGDQPRASRTSFKQAEEPALEPCEAIVGSRKDGRMGMTAESSQCPRL